MPEPIMEMPVIRSEIAGMPGKIDALVLLGMGPVKPELRGPEGDRHPVVDFERMRAITIAGKELVAHGLVSEGGAVIPTGRTTADPGVVDKALADSQQGVDTETLDRMNLIERQRTVGKPQTPEEAEKIKKTSEAELMSDLLKKTVAKPGEIDRKDVPVDILPEDQAKNTIENVINTINLMDMRKGGKWEGSVGILTSNFGHIPRIKELFNAFGIGDKSLIPLSAEAVLEHYGYDKSYLARYNEVNVNEPTIRNQEKFLQGVRKLPEYLLPEAALFSDDGRLKSVVGSLDVWFGKSGIDIFEKHPELRNFQEMPANELREHLKSIPWVKPDDSYGDTVNYDAWRQDIVYYDQMTKDWVSAHSRGDTH
jgi:hypothetical protein